MEKLAHDMQSAVGKVAKGATEAASKASKGISQTASKATTAAAKMAPSMSHDKAKGKDPASSGKKSENETFADENSLIKGLVERRITAAVQDLDYFRNTTNLLVVKTNYIIHVKCVTKDNKPEFGFILSKTFSAFRTLVDLLSKEAEQVMEEDANRPKKVTQLAQYCVSAFRLIESQSTEYLGKVKDGIAFLFFCGICPAVV